MKKLHTSLFVSIAAATLALGSPAMAQSIPSAQSTKKEKLEDDPRIAGPGTLDAQLTVGVAPFIGVAAEPAVDLSLIPLPADLTASIGASFGAEYCVGCLVLAAFGYRVRAWGVKPMARALVHLGVLSKALELPELDIYGGLTGGVTLYRFTLSDNANTVSANVNEFAIGAGPVAGVHYLFTDHLFVGAEARFLLWFGTDSANVTVGDEVYVVDYDNFIRNGMTYTFHAGLRF